MSSAPAPSDSIPLSVNGVEIDADAILAESASHPNEADVDHAARLALVVRELLTQKAVETSLLAAGAELDDDTIDRLLELECATPAPSDEECRRYYAANMQKFNSPELVFARHILFALTEKAAMTKVRARAEETHRELIRHPDRFEALAQTLSNCPSGQVGGNLGQLTRGESVPEFETAIFGNTRIGLLPGLVNSRYGFHIVSIERRIPGAALPYETVRSAIERYLSEHVRHKSIQQYLTLLASGAELTGITLDVRPGFLLQ
ncbi:peptidylprolyl isomerase [Herbaspirillum sp. RV1423]|uniref:peptidylprolyl isomerase n=1 Tax=Herbaspirillum sp. RV1423 TaxID=1443993 RepID=UPI0004BA8514|nr:peptidylprolyl isomerase [Herbaspirillum sp. RV1423]